ncbi:MAG: DnaJ C-terminal domain-containing protein [Hyphomicrobium aestuarii]|nr:DnaJ C-terminal domain-containing protein [Hyphomicrobium aestuarii]
MVTDPYELLGVKKSASSAELQKAYRRLAKQLHPDLNPGNKQAESQFKEVTAAYDLVRDTDKRARFDRGEIDGSGAERPRERYYRNYAQGNAGPDPYASDAGFADFSDTDTANDFLSGLFGRGSGAGGSTRGQDVRYLLAIGFVEAVNGGKRSISLADGSNVEVTIPPGTQTSQILRLRGRGNKPARAGEAGDALIEIEVQAHAFFTRTGDDIHVDLPISLIEAVLGAKVAVPTCTGPVTMTIPKGANTGRVLRLKGRGAARAGQVKGDQYVAVKVMLPDEPDTALETFMASWQPAQPYDLRKEFEV